MYQITEEFRDLSRRIIDVDGEKLDQETGELLGEEAAKELESELMAEILANQELGAESVLKIIKNLKMLNEGLDLELKALQAIKTKRKAKIDRLEDSVRIHMLATAQDKIETTVGIFKTNKGRESIVVHDQDKLKAISADFIRVKVTEAPDKAAIKNALKIGEKIDPSIAEIVRGEPTLSIK